MKPLNPVDKKLYIIGLPLEHLTSAIAQWALLESPSKMGLSPAKKEGWVCLHTKNPLVGAAIIETIPDARVVIKDDGGFAL